MDQEYYYIGFWLTELASPTLPVISISLDTQLGSYCMTKVETSMVGVILRL